MTDVRDQTLALGDALTHALGLPENVSKLTLVMNGRHRPMVSIEYLAPRLTEEGAAALKSLAGQFVLQSVGAEVATGGAGVAPTAPQPTRLSRAERVHLTAMDYQVTAGGHPTGAYDTASWDGALIPVPFTKLANGLVRLNSQPAGAVWVECEDTSIAARPVSIVGGNGGAAGRATPASCGCSAGVCERGPELIELSRGGRLFGPARHPEGA